MEYASGGMLFNQLANEHYYGFKEEVASKMVYRILEAVQFMHSQGIAHRDLKPENILLMGDEINPDQCAFARNTQDQDMRLWLCHLERRSQQTEHPDEVVLWYARVYGPRGGRSCGMFPSAYCFQKGNGYNAKADIYSIGCITFILLTGDLPFDDDSYSEIERQTLEDELVFDSLQWKGIVAHLYC